MMQITKNVACCNQCIKRCSSPLCSEYQFLMILPSKNNQLDLRYSKHYLNIIRHVHIFNSQVLYFCSPNCLRLVGRGKRALLSFVVIKVIQEQNIRPTIDRHNFTHPKYPKRQYWPRRPNVAGFVSVRAFILFLTLYCISSPALI